MEKMGRRVSFCHILLLTACALFLVSFSSCSTARSNTKYKAAYSKKRTRHQPKWNATTSQTTTYYIKKNNARKRHNP